MLGGEEAAAQKAASIAAEHNKSLESIRAEHMQIKAQLRDYELAFQAEHGRRPRKKKDWHPVFQEYERYAALREAERLLMMQYF